MSARDGFAMNKKGTCMSFAWNTVALALGVLVLTACQQQEAEPAATEAVSDAPAAPADAEPSSGSANLWQGGAQVPLDIQVAHPNGVVLQLTSLQSRDTETVVGVRVINGDDKEIDLNRFNNRDGYIVIGTGERLYLSPPVSNAKLSVQPGQTLEGELVFLGRLPQAQSAVLVLNENSSADSEHTQVPGFRINLPLAGATPPETVG